MTKRIYIAGSVQLANLYKYGTRAEQVAFYNEGTQMQLVVDVMMAELKQYDVMVFRTTLDPYMDLNASAKKANELYCTSYYSIHSNAGGGQGVTAIKQTSLLVPKAYRDKSAIMATELCKAIEALGRHNRGTYGRKNSWGGEYYSDLRQPKMPATILEVEFHDWDLGAEWIVKNRITIGKALAQAIVKIEGLVRIPQPYPGPWPTSTVSTTRGTVTDIKRWQSFLCWYGLTVAIDGKFGPDTQAKTRMFQAQNGLVADGSAGPLTITKAKTIRK